MRRERCYGEILTKYGTSVCDDPRRCEGLLWDLCGDYRKEVKLLVLVLREGVVAEMSSRPANIPPALLIARLTKHMQEELVPQ